VNEARAAERSAETRRLLAKVKAATAIEDGAGLAAVLSRDAERAVQLWHVHPTAPYQSYDYGPLARANRAANRSVKSVPDQRVRGTSPFGGR